MIRILHVVSMMNVGGMESYIMNMYRQIDRTKIQFDFLVHHKAEGVFEKEIKALGGRIHRTSVLDDGNVLKYLLSLKKVFSGNEYRIVHGHMSSLAFLYLWMAKRAKIPWRFLHCHCPSNVKTLKGYARHFLFKLAPKNANVRLACSNEAGKYQYKNDSFEVIPNGIDIERFYYSESDRKQIRKELNLDGKFVIGHVGRFFVEKNHMYMLEVFRDLKKQIPNATLMLLGDGFLKDQVRKRAQELQISDSVLFMGLIQECAPYYQAMDVFILPSIYEGLPLTGIEAQCAGLPCLFSSTTSPEIKLSAEARFIPVGVNDINKWVEALVAISKKEFSRSSRWPALLKYDSKSGADKMVKRYMELWEKKA